MNKVKAYKGIGTVLVAGLLLAGCSSTDGNGSSKDAEDKRVTQTESPGKNTTKEAKNDVKDSVAVVNTVNSFYESVYSLDLEKTQENVTPALEAFITKNNLSSNDELEAFENLSKDARKDFINIYKDNFDFNKFVKTPSDYSTEDILAYTGFSAFTLMGASMASTGDSSYVFDESAVNVEGDKATVDLSKGTLTVNGETVTPTSNGSNLFFVKEKGKWVVDYVENFNSYQSEMTQ